MSVRSGFRMWLHCLESYSMREPTSRSMIDARMKCHSAGGRWAGPTKVLQGYHLVLQKMKLNISSPHGTNYCGNPINEMI